MAEVNEKDGYDPFDKILMAQMDTDCDMCQGSYGTPKVVMIPGGPKEGCVVGPDEDPKKVAEEIKSGIRECRKPTSEELDQFAADGMIDEGCPNC